MSIEQSLLGHSAEYPSQYAPELLYPIARASARATLGDLPELSQGIDWWHVFEISWLNPEGVPQVAIGRLHIPADSVNLIESKSLKLYFNSFNFERLSREDFVRTVEQDLSAAAQAKVSLELLPVDQLPISTAEGLCLDQMQATAIEFQPNAALLALAADQPQVVEQSFYSHLLRSNCPVTNQPDWGTLMIRYRGAAICPQSLLAYIISYRQHNGFHEQCVEQIFADIWQQLQPEQLMVYAAYTRRGGLDINPCRVSDLSWMPQPIRLARQ